MISIVVGKESSEKGEVNQTRKWQLASSYRNFDITHHRLLSLI